jgi:hypothetical protein
LPKVFPMVFLHMQVSVDRWGVRTEAMLKSQGVGRRRGCEPARCFTKGSSGVRAQGSDTVLNVKRQLAKSRIETDALTHDGVHDVHELVH